MILQGIAGFFATLSFSVLFNVPRKHYLPCGITGMVGWLCYLFSYSLHPSVVFASFAATAVLTAISRFFAFYCKAPITIFLISGIFTLVPGAGIYYTAYYLFMGQNVLAASKGIETIKIAVAIALGIVMVHSLPYSMSKKTANKIKK